jgi:hypothetical protein
LKWEWLLGSLSDDQVLELGSGDAAQHGNVLNATELHTSA